jgi:hypothetical protein
MNPLKSSTERKKIERTEWKVKPFLKIIQQHFLKALRVRERD